MKLSIARLQGWSPCYEGLEFARKRGFDWGRVWEECERGDWLIWWLERAGLMDQALAVRIAIGCAERVVGIFEKKYPEDKRPREAIEAAKNWLADPSDKKKKAAAASAAAAAARGNERKWQADFIRGLVGKCPFENEK